MKTVFLLAIIVAAVVAFFVLRSPVSREGDIIPEPATRQAETNLDAESHTIRITDKGTVPRDITMSQGDTVTFVNDTSARHWPASDVHPIHARCPGFDAVGGLQAGETYSHVFRSIGTCPYHDHLMVGASSFKGIITIQ